MAESSALPPNQPPESLRNQVQSAVLWRSGTRILGQVVAWGSTFLVIRILTPADYGLFAMTQVVLVLLNMLNGMMSAIMLPIAFLTGIQWGVHGLGIACSISPSVRGERCP